MIAKSPSPGYTTLMDIIHKKRNTKQSNAIIQNRIDHIITLLARGMKRAQILVDPEVESWGLTNSAIDNYLRKAKDDIVGNSMQARTEHLGRAILNLDYMYKVALENAEGDQKIQSLKLCLDIQKEKNRLLKLTEVYKPSEKKEEKDILPAEVRDMIDNVRIINPPVKEKYLDEEVGRGLLVGADE